MNFVFVSPQFPHTYWQFCDRLRRRGVNVLGIGDTPYDQLDGRLKDALTEYYWVQSLQDYPSVFKAVAFFSYKYGKIDWIESNNEYWLAQDAALRTDFNVTTGPSARQIRSLQSKADMKLGYHRAGVATARQIRLTTLEAALDFVEGEGGIGWPAFAKPERGVGAGGVARIDGRADLECLLGEKGQTPYVLEEYVEGQIFSYDAILDSRCQPLFENMEEFPPSMARVATEGLDLWYCSLPAVDPILRQLGRATAWSLGLGRRFVHMEFFRLAHDKPGLGQQGDYVGLEVNVRPPGGYSPDMMNFAHSTDVYQIWADMVTLDRSTLPPSRDNHICVYAGRRDAHAYAHSHEDVIARYGDSIVMCERMPDALSNDMGNQMYTARLDSMQERDDFIRYVQERAD